MTVANRKHWDSLTHRQKNRIATCLLAELKTVVKVSQFLGLQQSTIKKALDLQYRLKVNAKQRANYDGAIYKLKKEYRKCQLQILKNF